MHRSSQWAGALGAMLVIAMAAAAGGQATPRAGDSGATPGITFAPNPNAPVGGVPAEARGAGTGGTTTSRGSSIEFGEVPDSRDHRPLSVLIAGTIASLKVTWADSARFRADTLAVATFLRRMLVRPTGARYKFQVWSQLLGVPDLVAEVAHVRGTPGRLLIWASGSSRDRYVYLDGTGTWWFGFWEADVQ